VLAARDRGRPRPHWSFPWPLTATGRAKTTCRPHLVRFRLSTAPQAVSIFFYLFDISMQISRYVGRVLRECSLSVLLVGATGSGPRRANHKSTTTPRDEQAAAQTRPEKEARRVLFSSPISISADHPRVRWPRDVPEPGPAGR
jgi:hypothetical protein